MAEADWAMLTAAGNQALDGGDVSKGVSGSAFTPPDGGGTYVYGFNSLQAVIGVAGKYYDALAAFNPIAAGKGGSIRAAMRRYSAGADYAPMIAFLSGLNVQTANAYVLGLSSSSPYQIVLKKGTLQAGLDPTASDVLRVSDESFSSQSLWFHLRLDVIVNPQSDVVLNVRRSVLAPTRLVTAPVWEAIPGMDQFVDDSNNVLTGTAPLTSGHRGVVAHYNGGSAGRVSLFDHVEIFRQTSP